MQRVLVVLAFLVLVALLSVDIYLRLQPPKWTSAAPITPRPTASPFPTAASIPVPPVPTPGARISIEESRVGAAPTARPEAPRLEPPRPPAPRPTADDSATTIRAPARPTAKKPRTPKPASPNKPAAAEGKPATTQPGGRTFVSGETTFDPTTGETSVEAKAGAHPEVPLGFDPGGVAVKVAPKVAAKIEFDVQPKRLKAGDAYAIRVYFRNQGKKAIKIRELRVASTLNGTRSESALTPKMKEIPPQQMALLAELPSVWSSEVKSWSMEVTVRSGHGDVYKNAVSWH